MAIPVWVLLLFACWPEDNGLRPLSIPLEDGKRSGPTIPPR
jgi:hypothetical protein